jgi:tRNA threonylcarbamoyladenosine biosynthesis protein TsaB
MYIITLRTDKPEAELGLYNDQQKLQYFAWQAHKELSDTIQSKIRDLMSSNNLDLKDLEGIVVFKGPGSFTGLRIGITVANALAYSLNIPIVSSLTGDWIDSGIKRLLSGQNEKTALPEYGADPHITQPRK